MAQFCAVCAGSTEPLRPRTEAKCVSEAGLSRFDRTLCEKVRAKITHFFYAIAFF